MRQIAYTLAELDQRLAELIAAGEARAPHRESLTVDLCAGLTLEAAPCTRQARRGSRYCYLHGAQEEQAS